MRAPAVVADAVSVEGAAISPGVAGLGTPGIHQVEPLGMEGAGRAMAGDGED